MTAVVMVAGDDEEDFQGRLNDTLNNIEKGGDMITGITFSTCTKLLEPWYSALVTFAFDPDS